MKRKMAMLCLFLLLLSNTACAEESIPIPNEAIEAVWDEYKEALSPLYTVSDDYEILIGNDEYLEGSTQFTFTVGYQYNKKSAYDSPYDGWYFKAIFDVLNITAEEVKGLNGEELVSFLQLEGFDEQAESIAGYIMGSYELEKSKHGMWKEEYIDIYAKISCTPDGYFVDEIRTFVGYEGEDIESNPTIAQWISELVDKAYNDSKERFLKMYPDLTQNMEMVQGDDGSREDTGQESENDIIIYIVIIAIAVVLCFVCYALVKNKKCFKSR